MDSIKQLWKKVRTKPSHLVVISKAIGGGTEQISVNFYVKDLEELEAEAAKAYKVVDARVEVIKGEMKKVEDEIRKAANKEAK